CVAALRRLAARDTIERRPPTVPDGEPTPLFPETDAAAEVVLANLTGLTLEKNGTDWKLTAGTPDPTVRPALLPTAAIQELLCGRPGAGSSRAAGPRVTAAALAADGKSVTFTTDSPLLQPTITADSVSVTHILATGVGGWKPAAAPPTFALDAAKTTVTAAFGTAVPSNTLVRLVVRGTGPTPVLGADLAPLAG